MYIFKSTVAMWDICAEILCPLVALEDLYSRNVVSISPKFPPMSFHNAQQSSLYGFQKLQNYSQGQNQRLFWLLIYIHYNDSFTSNNLWHIWCFKLVQFCVLLIVFWWRYVLRNSMVRLCIKVLHVLLCIKHLKVLTY